MRLVNAKTLTLEDFALRDIPQYAILSHTWDQDEVTFQEMSESRGTSKKGFRKIEMTCQLALQHGLAYAWVDTCCIDKTSSAELTESINSMFRWYRDSQVCFVWLADLKSEMEFDTSNLASCRWTSRGWTLQELLAPLNVQFYDATWCLRRVKLEDERHGVITNATGIPWAILADPDKIGGESVAAKMAWAAHRKTTRTEDMAYCLLGIFDISMPLIYGEGQKAFQRLQEEIVERSNDLTIFAWSNSAPAVDEEGGPSGLFARTPEVFHASGNIRNTLASLAEFAVTNRGLLVKGGLNTPVLKPVLAKDFAGREQTCYLLLLGETLIDQRPADGGIVLYKIGPALYCRDMRFPLLGFDVTQTETTKLPSLFNILDYYISMDRDADSKARASIHVLSRQHRDDRIHIPKDDPYIDSDLIMPKHLWDPTCRIFLHPTPYRREESSAVMRMVISPPTDDDDKYPWMRLMVGVLCVHVRDFNNNESVSTKLIDIESDLWREVSELFLWNEFETKLVDWLRLSQQFPDLEDLGNTLVVSYNGSNYRVTLEFPRTLCDIRLPTGSTTSSQHVRIPRVKVRKSKSSATFKVEAKSAVKNQYSSRRSYRFVR